MLLAHQKNGATSSSAGYIDLALKVKRITINSTNPYFILVAFWTCFFSLFSSFNDEKIKLQGLQ